MDPFSVRRKRHHVHMKPAAFLKTYFAGWVIVPEMEIRSVECFRES